MRWYWKLRVLLMALLTIGMAWFHIVLHLRWLADKDSRRRLLQSLLGSLKRKHRHSRYVWVWHRTPSAVHCHILVGAITIIDSAWMTGRWRRLMAKYGQVQYRPRDCFCRRRTYPLAVLRYMLGINPNHPRELQPWLTLTGRVIGHNFAADGSSPT